MRPYLKWIGGKQRLLPEILENLPDDLERRVYVEPFLGGGAVLLALADRVGDGLAADLNMELIATWDAVQRDAASLAAELDILCRNTSEEAFQLARAEFNQLKAEQPLTNKPEIRLAALFIFLNKLGFNGLYRVNKSGKFNVPYGKAAKNPDSIFKRQHLALLSEHVQHINFSCMDYKLCLELLALPCFIYLDPPFPPKSKTANFASYTPGGFGDINHLELATELRKAEKRTVNARRDVKFMLSMPDQPFVRELYRGYRFTEVMGVRSSSGLAKGRGKVGELLITNY